MSSQFLEPAQETHPPIRIVGGIAHYPSRHNPQSHGLIFSAPEIEFISSEQSMSQDHH